MQIVLTLQSHALDPTSSIGMRQTWLRISHDDATMLEDLKAFAVPWRNFSNVRKALDAILRSPGTPCIPFIGTNRLYR